MFTIIRKSRLTKLLSVLIIFSIFSDIFYPLSVYALGGGPSQPEVDSFEPIGTTEMVDLFTGDFTYNIPLLDVGGYPINLSYHSGITADQEASWVGLGWNVNPGVINRGLRGIPDDFKGDEIEKEFFMKANTTYGITVGANTEFFGLSRVLGLSFGASLGINYNNYRGLGMEVGKNIGVRASMGNRFSTTGFLGFSNGTDGIGINSNLSFSGNINNKNNQETTLSVNGGLVFNNRAGLKATTFGGSVETKARNSSSNGGSSIGFALPTYFPQIQMPMLNTSLILRATLGTEIFGLNANVAVDGYFSSQWVSQTKESVKSYGYLYLGDYEERDNPLLDINREKDGGFNENTPALPITNLTYDTYMVSGQGIGGTYRPHRGSFGIVSDRKVSSSSNELNFPEIEIGGGNLVKVGTNFHLNFPVSESGSWTSGNNLTDIYSYKTPQNARADYESVYFRQAGEKTYDNTEQLFNNIGGSNPAKIKITKEGAAERILQVNNGQNIPITSNNYNNKRIKRNEVISYLTSNEAKVFGTSKKIKVYVMNGNLNFYEEPRINNFRKEHHISEIAVTRSDGARYIYGIPAYNTSQEEATFAIKGVVPNGTTYSNETRTGTINYTPNSDDRVKNGNGIDEYYSKDKIPSYAHSYLLTDIFSSDYVDIDNNGPSPQDLGTYVKFNYSKINNYKWSIPYDQTEASYNEGLRSDKNDDKASYLRGEKELWYLHSIETKTHIAFFYTSNRIDGRASVGTSTMKKLDKIVLYSVNDYYNSNNPIPIKTVYFNYEYTLCPEIPNRNYGGDPYQTGKLTLTSLYFTYGKSEKGSLNKYTFSYGEFRRSDGTETSSTLISNPRYDIKGYDRWANYQENTNNRPNAVFPYTNQNKGQYYSENRYIADYNATSWNLTTIKLPTGGKIKIDYEADDYAYVQDKKAMEMFFIDRVQRTNGSLPSNSNLYDNNGLNADDYKNTIVLKLPQHYVDQGISIYDLLLDENGNTMEHMYFKFLVDIGNNKKNYEFVNGYSKIDINNSSVNLSAGEAYIALQPVESQDNVLPITMSPIVQACLNFALIYMPRVAYDQPDPNSSAIANVISFMSSRVNNMAQFIAGANRTMVLKKKCKNFDSGKSFVRLYNPIGTKKGGGTRVKRVRISDEWDSFTNREQRSEYGQEYDYTTEYNGRKISSGVASYEPGIGGDENPFRLPKFFSEKNILAPNKDYFLEEPFGESFYPGANVGYRKVKVSNYVQEPNTLSKTGWIEHEFYTSFDFPTFSYRTDLDTKRKKSNPVLNLLRTYIYDNMTASQGFVVERNDMHGKHKSTMNFNQGGVMINGVITHYKRDGNKITNESTVITPENEVLRNKNIGMDFDFVVDMRESSSIAWGGGLSANLDAFLGLFIPITVPVILPTISNEEVKFKSVVTTKVIDRYGIVDRVEVIDNGAKIITENKAFDSETGEVLLTKTFNEFEDFYYSLNYPAHWAYAGMEQAYQNIALTTTITTTNGVFSNNDRFFTNGDELIIGENKYWVYLDGNTYKLIDRDGNLIGNGSHTVKVLRSGHKNIQNMSIGAVISKADPILNNTIYYDGNSKIISSGALELIDTAFVDCNCFDIDSELFNPFVFGLRNNWRPIKDYLYLTQREYNEDLKNTGYNTDIRKNGPYVNYKSFWIYNNGKWSPNYDPSWIWTNRVTKYSHQGVELENMDPLNIYSAGVYGYNNTKLITTADNAKYKEIGFDGFEDDTDYCNDDHFRFRYFISQYEVGGPNAEITNKESHSGKKSIKVRPNKRVSMIKHLHDCQ